MKITDFGKIMVIVPHQDDELLLTAGVLYSAAHAGLNPHVVMVTNGDYGCHDHRVGYARLRETLAGVEMLGVPNEQVTFLGYADTGMPRAESFLAGLYDETDERFIPPTAARRPTVCPKSRISTRSISVSLRRIQKPALCRI